MQIYFRTRIEAQPGDKWREFFQIHWAHYRVWFMKEGESSRPRYLTCRKMLREHMPELIPTYDRLVSLAGGGDLEARFLSMWVPPPYLSACSQLALSSPIPVLIRNYDYSPKLFEGAIWHTNYVQPVIGMSDVFWGLLDGINASGLSISLTFGGSREVGIGFGIPLIVRYILETCRNTKEAIDTAKRLPSHMAYNLTFIDATGQIATVFLHPIRPTEILNSTCATNHQSKIDWVDFVNQTHSVERLRALNAEAAQDKHNLDWVSRQFLLPPLYSTDFHRGYGTLYTSMYYPQQLTALYYWHGFQILRSFQSIDEPEFWVQLA